MLKAESEVRFPKWKTGDFVDCSNIRGKLKEVCSFAFKHMRIWIVESYLAFLSLFFEDLLEFRDKIEHLVGFNHRDAFILGDYSEASIRVPILCNNQKI